MTVTPWTGFGLFAAVAWWLLERVAASKPRVEQRLDEFREPSLRRRNEGDGDASRGGRKKARTVSKFLAKASPTLAKPLQPKSDAGIGKLKTRLVIAGFRSEAAPTILLMLKLVGLGLGLTFGGGGARLIHYRIHLIRRRHEADNVHLATHVAVGLYPDAGEKVVNGCVPGGREAE